MDRQTWLQIRNNGQIPLQIYHQYYIEKGGDLEWKDFSVLFQIFVNQHMPNPSVKMVREYDNRYSVLIICTEEGEFLKYN